MNIDNDEQLPTIDEAIQLFAEYARGNGDFDELDLKEVIYDKEFAAQRQALRDEVMEAVGEYTDLHTKYEGAYDGTDGLYTSIEDNESQELTGDKLALLANFVSDKTVNELRTAIATIFEGKRQEEERQ